MILLNYCGVAKLIKLFDEFNSKFKFIFGFSNDTEAAEALGIKRSTYASFKKLNKIPYEEAIKYCEDKNIDLAWLLNLKSSK